MTSDLGVWGLDVKELGELGKQREISIDIAPFVHVIPSTMAHSMVGVLDGWLSSPSDAVVMSVP